MSSGKSTGAAKLARSPYTQPEYQLTKPGTSGTPFTEGDISIVDDNWNRLPPHATGEIAVKTPMVLKGYLGQGDLDSTTIKDGYYRIGDVGHLDEDGFLYITYRIKDIIVAGGVKIYPAEIEDAALAHK